MVQFRLFPRQITLRGGIGCGVEAALVGACCARELDAALAAAEGMLPQIRRALKYAVRCAGVGSRTRAAQAAQSYAGR